MAGHFAWLSLALASATATAPLSVPTCPTPTPLPTGCGSPLDVAIVVDNSKSTAEIHGAITSSLLALVDSFALDPSRVTSPRLTVISYDAPSSNRTCAGPPHWCAADGSAEVLIRASADSAAIRTAVSGRPAARGMSCTSCGLALARAQLTQLTRIYTGRSQLVVLITDSAQNTAGTDALAVHEAELMRTSGFTIAAIGLGTD